MQSKPDNFLQNHRDLLHKIMQSKPDNFLQNYSEILLKMIGMRAAADEDSGMWRPAGSAAAGMASEARRGSSRLRTPGHGLTTRRR
jgi:hypothetical protein